MFRTQISALVEIRPAEALEPTPGPQLAHAAHPQHHIGAVDLIALLGGKIGLQPGIDLLIR